MENRTQASKSKKRPDLILLLILALLPGLFFWRLLTPNPADRLQIAGGDFTAQYFPLRAFTAQEWVRGRPPLWNPYLYGGQPGLADIQGGALYPPHVLEALILGWGGPLVGREIGFPLWALELQVMAHFALAAGGTYLFVRHLGLQTRLPLRRARFGGVIASLTFTYGGYLTGFPVQQITILETSAWLPWVLWGLSVALRPPFVAAGVRFRPSSRAVGWAGLAFGLAILAGHPQTALYIFYLTLAYALFLAFWIWRSRPAAQALDHAPHPGRRAAMWSGRQILLRALTIWLAITLLGGMIAAAQILPTAVFIRRSLRAELSYEAVSAGLPLNELVSILYPGFFGGSPEYVGVVSLVLIALALVLVWPRPSARSPESEPAPTASPPNRGPETGDRPLPQAGEASPSPTAQNSERWSESGDRPPPKTGRASSLTPAPPLLRSPAPLLPCLFWTGTGLVSLLLAFGGSTFLYALFYLLAPGFEAVRQQERAFLIYSFSAAVLAGFGAMLLTGPLPRPVRAAYRRFERRLRLTAGLFFGLTAVFIYGAAAATARGDEVNLFVGVLRHHLFGLMILSGVLIWLALRPRRWIRRRWGMALLAGWVGFNLFTVNWRFNLAEPAAPPPFTPPGLVRFLQTNLAAPGLDLAPGRIASGGLLPGGNSAGAVYDLQDLTGNTPLQLATVDAFLGRMPAWRMWQLLNVRYVVADRDISGPGLEPVFAEGALRVFKVGDPFPRAWFVSEVEVIDRVEPALARLAGDDFDLRRTAIVTAPLAPELTTASAAEVEIIALTPTRLEATVEAPGQHLLVFSQIYYPGWQARLDGRPLPLRRVNVVQQGVVIPPGSHTVDLRFSPAGFWGGAFISGLGLLMWLGLIIKRG